MFILIPSTCSVNPVNNTKLSLRSPTRNPVMKIENRKQIGIYGFTIQFNTRLHCLGKQDKPINNIVQWTPVSRNAQGTDKIVRTNQAI